MQVSGNEPHRGRATAGWIVLGLLLTLQFGLLLASVLPPTSTLGSDEGDYASTAEYLQIHRAFPRVMDGSWGKPFPADFWGNSNWRPIGYPVALAMMTWDQVHSATARVRVAVVQLLMAVACIVLMYRLLTVSFDASRMRWLGIAGLLGAQPWAFAFAGLMGPESLASSLTWLGIAWLAWAVTGSGRTVLVGTFAATFVLAVTAILRPESAALVPPLVALGLVLGLRRLHDVMRIGLVASLAFVAVIGAQVAYRYNLTGRFEIFGPARFFNAGVFRWVDTWLNTEKAAYDGFAYRIGSGALRTRDLPARAFGSREERAEIEQALERIRAQGGYSRDVDMVFAAVGNRRAAAAPIANSLVPGMARVAQRWLNLETSSQLLCALSKLPPSVSRVIVGLAAGARLLVLGAALFAGAVMWRQVRAEPRPSFVAALTLLAAAYIVLRTTLMALLFVQTARHLQPAWMPLLWCGATGLAIAGARRRVSGSAPAVASRWSSDPGIRGRQTPGPDFKR